VKSVESYCKRLSRLLFEKIFEKITVLAVGHSLDFRTMSLIELKEELKEKTERLFG
jgi:glutaredoxin